jgi:hypothetical protein
MRHPFQDLPIRKSFAASLLPLILLTVAFMIIFNFLDQPLRTDSAPNGIISFELARNMATAKSILDSWDVRAGMYAAFGLGLDFLFMVIYSSTIALACIWVTRSPHLPPILGRIGILLAWGQWLAAVFDATENSALLVLLLKTVAAPWPQIATFCALVKFSLILLGLAYALGGLISSLVNLYRQKNRIS